MLKVQVSPFLGISEWTDPISGITFSKKAGVISIPDGTDLTGIKKHIRLNQLIFVGGNFVEAPSVVEAPKGPEIVKEPEPEVEEPKAKEPETTDEVIAAPEVVETPKEEPTEAPKAKKKAPAKKKTEQ
jgi:outer membrane biosynthesis protein TonB